MCWFYTNRHIEKVLNKLEILTAQNLSHLYVEFFKASSHSLPYILIPVPLNCTPVYSPVSILQKTWPVWLT